MSVTEKEPGLTPGYKPGRFRPFLSSNLPASVVAKTQITTLDYKLATIVFALAAITRTYKIHYPAKVVFDETHFGHFAQDYYYGDFFVDVHPPLVKLMFYYIAVLFGWDGQFAFENIGDSFDNNVPFVAMRYFSAISGIFAVVATFFALRASGCRSRIAAIGSMLVIFENSLATQSRLIMLDSELVAFTALTVLSFQKFQISEPFTKNWYKTLLGTGVALGLTVSTKLTGLFTFAWVCMWSLVQIWTYVGDLEVSVRALLCHIFYRLVAFLGVPVTIYCGVFSVHFMLLSNFSSGAAMMSPSFKAGLAASEKVRNTAVDVSYGSTVTIKHHRMNTYLHSHPYFYETGTQEQQVTMYGFDPDPNNEWVLETTGTNYDGKLDTKFRSIKDGDSVKIFHKSTRTYLRANDVRPPSSEHDYSNEVTCKGNRTDTEDINYEWKVNIFGRKPHSENELPLRKLRATETVFQLVHSGTQCVLVGHDVKLPEWAFGQNQVLCINGPTLPNTLWYIESNNHPVIDPDTATYPRVKLPELSLFQKLRDYHHSMWRVNKGLTEKHNYASIPITWPFVLRGINYFSSDHGDEKLTDEPGSHIYLLGNFVVYIGGLSVVIGLASSFAFYVLKAMNPFASHSHLSNCSATFYASLQYTSGWVLHFVPYWFMDRQLFAHHYLPSVYFLILTVSQFIEVKASGKSRFWSSFWLRVLEAFFVAAVYVFYNLIPLVYGTSWTVEQCQGAKWFLSWDFDCMAYSH